MSAHPNQPAPRGPIAALVGTMALSQLGAAVGATVVPIAGSFGVVAVRLVVAAVVVVMVARPHVRAVVGRTWWQALALAVVMVVMNNAVYVAIGRIGVGLAITLEFLGPLTIAMLRASSAWHIVGAVLALTGVALIGAGPVRVDTVGVIAGLVGAAAWAGYIVLFRGATVRGNGLQTAALAACVAALTFAPIGFATIPDGALDAHVLFLAAIAGLLSSALPFVVDSRVIACIHPRVYGVLTSSSPVFAVLAGWGINRVPLAPTQWFAVLLVVAASILAILVRGTTRGDEGVVAQ